ncbi:FHA domain-containing protein, partial [Rathayibacter tanaceti]|uniref:FHA domain-containing protein n=1 Tax=Rathayibacter tanaceti TaxID=1671680 RepID=UPI000A792588
MRLLLDLDDARSDIELGRHRDASTLGDLVDAATGHRLPPGTTLAVDSALHPVETPLADLLLLEGTRIARSPQPRPVAVRGWTATLSGGLRAGDVVEIPRSRALTVGRSPHADLVLDTVSASWEHLSVTREGDALRVRDAGSTNGTLVDGVSAAGEGVVVTDSAVVIAGGAALLLRPAPAEPPAPEPGSLHNVTPSATVPFNRPPRPGRAAAADPVVPPTRVSIASAAKFSVITVAAPLVLAFAMVLIMGDARYALFAALSPVAGAECGWSSGTGTRGRPGRRAALRRGTADAPRRIARAARLERAR